MCKKLTCFLNLRSTGTNDAVNEYEWRKSQQKKQETFSLKLCVTHEPTDLGTTTTGNKAEKSTTNTSSYINKPQQLAIESQILIN